MPVLSPLFASASEATTTSGTFAAAATTAALASGTEYLVIASANTLSTNSNSTLCEAEVTFGGTRYGMTRYQVGFAGAPDSASGGHVPTAFIVTGDGSSTVQVRHRRVSGSGTVVTTAHVACIPLDSLVENTHYWQAQATNSDTLTEPTAGTGYVGSGEQVDVTPGTTGDFLVIATGEFEFTSGSSSTDQAHMRCRVTEDPSGSPSSSNLMDNLGNAIDGPEIQFEGDDSWGMAAAQRWVDVVTLTSGTTYRFEIEREVVSGAANTGYRRERVFVFDLSFWPEVTVARDVDAQQGQDQVFATASAPAPSSAIDYLLLGAIVYQNNNSWLRTYFDEDPSGTPTRIPSSAGFGVGLPDTGNTTGDDYGLIGLQWDQQGVSAAHDYAIHCEADLQNCRWGNEHGQAAGGADDGVATVLVVWGMETSTSAPAGDIEGSASGSATASGTLEGEGALSGSASGSSSATGTLEGGSNLSGSASGSATASGALTGTGALSGSASGSATASLQTAFAAADAAIAFVGNSYTQDYGSMPDLLQHYLDERLPGNTTSLGPPPALGMSISNSAGNQWYPGMTLGGMALYPTIDQSSSGSTDAVDAILSVALDAYDVVVLTSGFVQESDPGDPEVADDDAVAREVLPGSGGEGVCLEVVRRIVDELETAGSTAAMVVRMSQEGFNVNAEADLVEAEETVRLQVLGARQLEEEGVVDLVVPDHYVWSRLQWGRFGSAMAGLDGPVPAYTSLTHTDSSQAGGRNYGWLQRSQGSSAPFSNNAHQSAVGTIVNTWIWGYAVFGIDPRGDTTFSGDPSGLPGPMDNMLNATGTRIYGGQNAGVGNFPYDTGTNPSGPPDSELDLDWSTTTQEQIQDRIVAAIDDYNAQNTEFDGLDGAMTGSASGAATASGDLEGAGALGGSSSGAATASGDLEGIGALAGAASGAGTASGALSGQGELQGSASGSASASGDLDGLAPGSMSGSASGSATASGELTGTGALSGSASGSATASLQTAVDPVLTGTAVLDDTVPPALCADTTLPAMTAAGPWYAHPEDEGSTLSERIVYPAVRSGRTVTQPATPVDLSAVTGVALEVWNGAAWDDVAGVGAVETEVVAGTSELQAGTYYRLTFAPASGALQAIADGIGTGVAIPRRWALTVPAGDLHLPSYGHGVLYLQGPPG